MSYNGSGTFNINSAGQPVVTGTVITSTAFNALTSDLATGLSTALTKDGQTTPTANIPMGTYKITGLGAGTVATDAVRLSQLQNGGTTTYITAAGTDTITGTVTPALTAYATGQQFSFVVAATNTTAVTLNVDGVGAKAVTRTGSVALVAGDMVTGQVVIVEYDGTRFQLINGNSFTNLRASGTLDVTGATTLSSTLAVTGATTLSSTLAVTGATTLSSTLAVTGITTVAAGSAALPAIVSTTGTADTGLWFPAADTVAASTAGAERLRIDSSGNLLVGTTSAVGLIGGIQASTSAYAGYFTSNYTASGNANLMFWGRSGGAVAAAVRYKDASTSMEFYSPTGQTVAYTTSSDYRIKENVQTMTGALAKVSQLRPVTYKWKEGFGVGESEGFIAHELQTIVPDCVSGEKDAVDADGNPQYQGIDTSFLVATLTSAIQELKAIIDTQAARIAALETK